MPDGVSQTVPERPRRVDADLGHPRGGCDARRLCCRRRGAEERRARAVDLLGDLDELQVENIDCDRKFMEPSGYARLIGSLAASVTTETTVLVRPSAAAHREEAETFRVASARHPARRWRCSRVQPRSAVSVNASISRVPR
jgi:hypothetical protein